MLRLIVLAPLSLGNILVAGSLRRVTGLSFGPALQYPWGRFVPVVLGAFNFVVPFMALRAWYSVTSGVRACGTIGCLDSTLTDASSPKLDDVVRN